MFDCSSCTLRALRALAADALPVSRRSSRLLLTPRLTVAAQRRHASTTSATASSSSPPTGEAYLNAAQLRHLAEVEHIPFAQETPGKKAVHVELARRDIKALKKELEWLPDPVKFADHVQYTLRCQKPKKALELVRLASRDRQCIVAWNHLVNYFMQRGQISDALDIFNEMKKRAQFPDSHTYLLLLRHLAMSTRQGNEAVAPPNVAKAVGIYNSMKSPTSRVRPSTIHTNAVLKVCAFGGDMDALWGIVSELPEDGPGAADEKTYTIILSSIRHGVNYEALQHLTPSQSVAKRREAVNECRRVWLSVVVRWRGGAVKIDEELVVAMARCLLVSERLQDWDDVLSLVQQTMNIKRLIAPAAERHTEHVPPDKQLRDTEAQDDEVGESSLVRVRATPQGFTPAEQSEYEEAKDTPDARVFESMEPSSPERPTSRRHNTSFVQPGNDTLDVLVQACSNMRTPKTAMEYWDVLTSDPYNIKPMLFNFHAQLRLLYRNRSSKRVADLLKKDLVKAGATPNRVTFKMAMTACVRDKHNRHVLENASTIVDVMEETLPDLEIGVLVTYLDLALLSKSGPSIIFALNRLDSVVHNLRSRILYGTDDRAMTSEAHRKDKIDTLHFFRTVIGAIDTLLRNNLVPKVDITHWVGRRSQLTAFVDRISSNMAPVQKEESEELGIDTARGGDGESKAGRKAWLPRHRSPALRSFQKWRRLQQLSAGQDTDPGVHQAWRGREERRSARSERNRVFGDSPADLGMW
ncbi:hypothetical protein B0A50_01243 [Salinomyces thailandicus]|uniref:Pentatricopeptide repeat protein n=1 Tax=Salinomyces thailandicus TaxID=706561 RepID=A0A4U0U9S9_9PEZI|nr:hypothetical protein B0A50_01243 [Salinomyces thailandica]